VLWFLLGLVCFSSVVVVTLLAALMLAYPSSRSPLPSETGPRDQWDFGPAVRFDRETR